MGRRAGHPGVPYHSAWYSSGNAQASPTVDGMNAATLGPGDASKVFFGKDIFIKNENKTFRVLIDYNKNTSVSVNYDNIQKRIVFDNLVPLKESYKEYNAYFVPDGSFNCFQYKNGEWIFYEDVDVRNKNISEKITNNKKENGLFNK